MEYSEIETLLKTSLALDEVHVSGEGSHFKIVAVSDVFEGMSRVKKQQMIYKPLSAQIADGSMHAITIKTFSVEQWKRERQFNL